MSVFATLTLVLWLPQLSIWAQNQRGPVVIGETVHLQSTALKESRTLFIAKPAGYDNSADKYPVLYLLDGESNFRFTAAIVDFLAAGDRIPKMLVIGIAAGEFRKRTHDLTPPSADERDNRFSPGNGGADTFLSFLGDELIPYVERNYRTRPYRLLAGHSFGGLLAVYALTTRPKLFNGYIAADPSLYWNNQAVVAQTESFFSRTPSLQVDFYMTATGMADQVPSEIERMKAALSRASPAGFRWKCDWLPEEDHASIPLPTFYRGLEVIFEPWRLPNPLGLFDPGGIAAIHRRFREAGRRFGYPERTTPPFTVSLVVAALMSAGRLEEASAVLLHDPTAYPPPWNQLDALARAYERRGDIEQAVRYYRMSLRENPTTDFARKKLTGMGVKVPTPQ